jgi:hypothetical protein
LSAVITRSVNEIASICPKTLGVVGCEFKISAMT